MESGKAFGRRTRKCATNPRYSTLVEGERYQRAKLLQYALFASKRGSLVLSPFEVTVLIQQRNRRQDIFSFD